MRRCCAVDLAISWCSVTTVGIEAAASPSRPWPATVVDQRQTYEDATPVASQLDQDTKDAVDRWQRNPVEGGNLLGGSFNVAVAEDGSGTPDQLPQRGRRGYLNHAARCSTRGFLQSKHEKRLTPPMPLTCSITQLLHDLPGPRSAQHRSTWVRRRSNLEHGTTREPILSLHTF
jgi:hypothetical protein